MNRINQLFSTKQKISSLFILRRLSYFRRYGKHHQSLGEKGINMIEIGIPFSDPMADGPVIQHAATRALKTA